MNGLVMPGVTFAYANFGRWVAMCGYAAYCDGAAELQRFQDGFICECGRATTVVWPSEDMVYGIERLLLMRPNPKHQNWWPGETLADLLEENVIHGITTRHAAELDGGLFATVGDRIILDALPHLNPRQELTR